MVDGVNICNIFKNLDVTVVNILLTRKTPADWFSYWRNQFYLLDILDYFKANLGSADKFILLDSDCVFTRAALLWHLTERRQVFPQAIQSL